MRAKESNEINNKELKENIADVAIGLLEEGSDYNELAYTKVEFGYLFDIDDHGIEALLKVITDKTTAYFAVQGTSMMRLNFSDELFNTTVEGFMNFHG
ncbi:hypothetical protein HMPREF0380_01214 [Eubacterium infirmum F0142]|nr:hypothetical protein HMPREF0380_01214 [Eubacterium infirmum F0142]STO01406.1 Uncharacterised protein [[Eubacterium] infirmum]